MRLDTHGTTETLLKDHIIMTPPAPPHFQREMEPRFDASPGPPEYSREVVWLLAVTCRRRAHPSRRGDGELGPLEKEGPLDDNCQWLWYPRQRGAHAFTIFHCMF